MRLSTARLMLIAAAGAAALAPVAAGAFTRTVTDFTRTTNNGWGANTGPIIIYPIDQRYDFPLPPGSNLPIIVENSFPGGSGGT